VIKHLQVARSARLKQINHAFGFRSEVRFARRQWIVALHHGRGGARGGQKGSQRQDTESDATLLEEPATGDELPVLATIQVGLTIHIMQCER
jgi:hypothetical protein